MTETLAPLSADRPSTDPAQDLFGHAPFARALAKAIQSYRSSDGIVLALYGPWGAGKSTVLAYVEHELNKAPEAERPVAVTFNPWWFSGQEHLAKAFLAQLQIVLPNKHAGFKAVGNLLAKFSSAIGSAIDAAKPGAGTFFALGARLLGGKPQDVPELKGKLSALLLKEKKRVLVIIDDIDRLSPEEVRQLFTVIKALADFPYVTYLLAFDREVASQAIGHQTGLPGERYLEKIVQVPFELPRADRATLQQALFIRLEAIMAPTPEGRLDQGYWINIFYAGLHPFFTVPRDVVRFTNALSVTYAAVVGEVNPVDFIAIECLRVFLPSVYDAIRTSPDEFLGYKAPTDESDRQRAVSFHQTWLDSIPPVWRSSTRELLERLFPRLESVWSNTHYGADSLNPWRKELRICVADVFPAYFGLSLPQGTVSRADVDGLIAVALDASSFAAALRQSITHRTAIGDFKTGPLLERLMDHVPDDLEARHAEPIISALHDIGDELISAAKPRRSAFDIGNESRVRRIVYHLLKKVPQEDRLPLLSRTLASGDAVRCFQHLLGLLAKEAKDGDADALLTTADTDQLATEWCAKIAKLSTRPDFLDRPALAELLHAWRHWSGDDTVINWWKVAAGETDAELKLLAALASNVTIQGFGDYAARFQLRVNPKTIGFYSDPVDLAERVQQLLDLGSVQERLLPAAQQFVREVKLMKTGKDPDATDFLDD